MAVVQFTGLASGIDSASLISALLDQQRKSKVEPLETKITALQDTTDAFSELKTKLSALSTSAAKFRAINGGAIAKVASSTDDTIVSATVSNSALNSISTIDVAQLARHATQSFDDRYSSSTSAIYSGLNDGASAADRTVSYTIGNGSDEETVSVVLTSSTTLSDFVTSFNTQSSKATASVVNTGTSSSPSYAILVTSNKTGTQEGEVTTSVGTAVSDGGAGAFDTETLVQAENAEFTLDGVTGTIERSTNSIGDVLSGVTFELRATGEATIAVNSDADSSASTIDEFVQAYNEIVSFIKENDLVTREENGDDVTNIFGPLANSALDNNILTALRGSLSGAGISGGLVNVLADLGITTERDGTLKFDATTFKEALADDPNSVQEILENLGEDLAAPQGTIAQFTQFNGLIDTLLQSNTEQVSSIQNRIADTEDRLSKEEARLTARFARLEALIGGLQQQQQSLSSILPT